jgi:hypothetical protein
MAATKLLPRFSTSELDLLSLNFGLQKEIFGAPNKTSKATLIGGRTLNAPDEVLDTQLDGTTQAELVVREAVKQYRSYSKDEEDLTFRRALAHDGYAVEFDTETNKNVLRPMVPEDLQLPKVDDEIHELLEKFDLKKPLGHLDQAIELHRKGDWAASNAQLRTFLEALFREIAERFFGIEKQKGIQDDFSALAKKGFIKENRYEWSGQGCNYLTGLFKLLNTEGSHPGLSDEDDSTLRLHVVLVTARMYLRRL